MISFLGSLAVYYITSVTASSVVTYALYGAGTRNLITASFVSVFWIMAVLAVSYLKFRKEELK